MQEFIDFNQVINGRQSAEFSMILNKTEWNRTTRTGILTFNHIHMNKTIDMMTNIYCKISAHELMYSPKIHKILTMQVGDELQIISFLKADEKGRFWLSHLSLDQMKIKKRSDSLSSQMLAYITNHQVKALNGIITQSYKRKQNGKHNK